MNTLVDMISGMGEYSPLVRRLGGQVIEIAPDSPHHINPMDIEIGLNDEDSPLSMKADFLLSLCELVVGGKDGLQPIEKTVIDRCVRLVYRELALGLEGAKMPLLQSLYEELLKQPEPEAKRVATALELYCTGSLNLFNHPTNRNMGAYMRKMALCGYVLQVDLAPVRELVSLQRRCSNNLNQVAIHANTYGGIYPEEISALQRDYSALWGPLSDLLKQLSALVEL